MSTEKNKIVRPLTIFYALLILVFIFLLVIAGMNYFLGAKNNFTKVPNKILPFPAAVINYTNFLSIGTLNEDLDSSRRFYESQDFSSVGLRVDFNTEDGQKRLRVKEKDILNKMIEKSNEYLMEVKVQNFEITLKEFINNVKNLDYDDKYVVNTQTCDELIKQFNIIKTQFENYQNREANLKKKIELVNNKLKEADDDIIALENKNRENESLIKKFNNESKKYKNYQTLIDDLEITINKKNNELKELKENKEIKKSELEEKMRRSESYLTKLNDANSKLIQEKTEKIKFYENEFAAMQKKLIESQNRNKELENDYIKLNKKIDDISLPNEFSMKTQIELENEILNLKTYINTLDDKNSYDYQNISETKKSRWCCCFF